MQPVRVQILTMSHALEEIVKLSEADFINNLLRINRLLLEIEVYLDQLRGARLSRSVRLTLNKFEKGFKELKIYLFLRPDLITFEKQALNWADILQHRAKLV